VADTWLDLEVRMTGATRAEFYSDGVKVCNINTNVPATTQLTGAGFNHFKSAGTGSRGYRFDHTSIAWTLSAARSP
jgi:hypothetical protein